MPPSIEVTPCSPSWLMTVAPSISSREPSSLVSRNVYRPAVGMVTLPITSAWKLSSTPKSAAVLQLTVGRSLSTFGVWPDLRVQIRSRAVCRSKVRSVTPGCCGGTAAAAGTACSRLASKAAPTSRDIRGRVNIDILIERSPQTPGRSGSRVDDHRCLGTLGSFCTKVHNFGYRAMNFCIFLQKSVSQVGADLRLADPGGLQHPVQELAGALLPRAAEHRGGRALFDDHPVVHEDDARGDLPGERHLMGD